MMLTKDNISKIRQKCKKKVLCCMDPDDDNKCKGNPITPTDAIDSKVYPDIVFSLRGERFRFDNPIEYRKFLSLFQGKNINSVLFINSDGTQIKVDIKRVINTSKSADNENDIPFQHIASRRFPLELYDDVASYKRNKINRKRYKKAVAFGKRINRNKTKKGEK